MAKYENQEREKNGIAGVNLAKEITGIAHG